MLTILGIDLSPIQANWYNHIFYYQETGATNYIPRAPPNCYFQVDDFESPWDFWDFGKPFDFIHVGSLAGSIKDVPGLLRKAN